MLSSLDDTFDEILTKDGAVFFVDQTWVKSLSTDHWSKTLALHSRLKQPSGEHVDKFFTIGLKNLTSEDLVQHFFGGSDSIESSDYHVVMDAFSELKPGVAVFYKTHLISSDVLRLLSKLIKHVQQHSLGWKFVFYGKTKNLTHIAKDRLFIKHYYPEEYKHPIGKTIINGNKQPEVTGKRFGFIHGLFVVSAITIAGWLIFTLVEQAPDKINSQPRISDVTVNVNRDKDNAPSKFQNSFEPNQTLEQMVKEFRLKALAFEKTMAEINAAQATTALVDDNESIKVANIEDNENDTSRFLSSELEKAIVANDLAFLESFNDRPMLAYGRNSKGETPLIISVNNGNERVLRWLLQKNIPVDLKDNFGRTALFYSAIKGNEDFVKQLVQANARISLASNLFKTPLMAAVHNNHYESAQLLLVTGKVNINAQDHSGWSALFYAVWNSNSKMASLLLEHGAGVHLVDSSGLNIDEVAIAAGFEEWQNRVNGN